jgi:BirA family biotin operon repressor/biotin-[acetyl-CoA-carboxylase] ligase
VLVADHQTAGRGRQNRRWVDEPGRALMVSVLLRPRPDLVPLITVIAGLAVIDLVDELLDARQTGQPRLPDADRPVVGLKWPNDVLVPAFDEAKLAGILTEATTAGSGSGPGALAVVVGTGLNLQPLEVDQQQNHGIKATSLAEVLDVVPTDSSADRRRELDVVSLGRNRVLGHYLRSLDRALATAEATGPAPVLDRYRSCCLTIGRQVRFATPSGDVEGLASDVAADGALILETDAGARALHAGDAHHLPPR